MTDNLIWIDLEMTGLDVKTQVIIEISTIITDSKLQIIAQGPEIAIHYPEAVFLVMEAWSREHHEKSGLMQRVRESTITCEQAEQRTLDFISAHCQNRKSPLCGNSVWQDRVFLLKYMPKLEKFMHYRNIDVSSIKELVKRWYPALPPMKKDKVHLATTDIKESIEELIYYRENVFLPLGDK